METKRCPKCQTEKSIAEFGRNRTTSDGLSGYCWKCQRSAAAASQQRKRREVIDHLGGRCVECGMSDWRALHIDHVRGGGRDDRQGSSINTFLNKVMSDTSGKYQLLCASCNVRKRLRDKEHKGARVYPRGNAGRVGARLCSRCQISKPLAEWPSNKARKDSLGVYCLSCVNELGAAQCQERRRRMFQALGGDCSRCGEIDADVLQIDHVGGGGHQERKTLVSSSAKFCEKVCASRGEYRLLCANCNWIARYENDQTVGSRVYERSVPTERKQGPGRGTAEGSRKSIGRSWWDNATPEQIAERNRKIAEKRRGTKLVDGQWVSVDD